MPRRGQGLSGDREWKKGAEEVEKRVEGRGGEGRERRGGEGKGEGVGELGCAKKEGVKERK